MNNLLSGAGAAMALLLSFSSSAALAAPQSPDLKQTEAKGPVSHDDVPAPPMALLFGVGAVGVIWGRRLAAKKSRDEAASPSD